MLDLIEAEEKREEARWLSGLHIQALATYAALLDHKGIPLTRAEQKKAEKVPDSEIERDREPMERFLKDFRRAVTGVQRFGAFVGRPDVFGEPPPERAKTAEELRREHANLDEDLTANLAEAFEGLVEAKRG